MMFPNGYKGVKKIFTAQILKLISSVCLIAFGIAVLITGISAFAEIGEGTDMTRSAILGLGTLVLFAAFFVLSIISYIMNLVGLHQAGKDEDSFRLGFYFTLFALVISVLSFIFASLNVGGGIADNITSAVSYICEILVILSVIRGVGDLAEKIGDNKIISLGNKVFVLLVIMVALAAVATLLPALPFFDSEGVLLTISGVLAILAGIFSVVGYIVYLIYLGKAKKMLKNN